MYLLILSTSGSKVLLLYSLSIGSDYSISQHATNSSQLPAQNVLLLTYLVQSDYFLQNVYYFNKLIQLL
jgi:hypothetical protein